MELKLAIQRHSVLAVDNIKLEDCSTDQRSISDQLIRGSPSDPMPTPANTFHTPNRSYLTNKNSQAESVSAQDLDHVRTTKVPTTFSTRIVTTASKLELLKTEEHINTVTTTATPVTVFNLTSTTAGIIQLDEVQMNQNLTQDNSTANPKDFYEQTTVADYGFVPKIDLHDLLLDTDNTQEIYEIQKYDENEEIDEIEPDWEIVEILENTIKLKSRKNHHRTHNSVSRTAASITVITSTLLTLMNL